MNRKELVANRKAGYSYEFLSFFEAGIALQGTEVKSLRNGGGSLQESYITIDKGEVWLRACHIAPYSHGNLYNHEERRPRKLLLHRYEIEKISSTLAEKGLTAVPLSLYLEKGNIKVRFAIARGKKLIDKRHALKESEEKRQMARAKKQYL